MTLKTPTKKQPTTKYYYSEFWIGHKSKSTFNVLFMVCVFSVVKIDLIISPTFERALFIIFYKYGKLFSAHMIADS